MGGKKYKAEWEFPEGNTEWGSEHKLNRRKKTSSAILRGNKKTLSGVPIVAQWVMNLASIYEDVNLTPGLVQWVKNLALLWPVVYVEDAAQIPSCDGCGVTCSCSSDSIPSLRTSICCKCSPKNHKKKKEKKKKKTMRDEIATFIHQVSKSWDSTHLMVIIFSIAACG